MCNVNVSHEKDAARARWRVETYGVEEGTTQNKGVAENLCESVTKTQGGRGVTHHVAGRGCAGWGCQCDEDY
jgi:hypothetical protein